MRLRPNLVLALLLPCVAACADDSYAVVSVLTSSGSIDDVAQFRVHVSNGTAEDTLYYPNQPSEHMHLDALNPVTFSVEFSSSRGGQATFEVEPLDRNLASLGHGKSTVTIAKGKVVNVSVTIDCDPYAPALVCGANQTCGLSCSADQPAVGLCYAAGPGKPGDSCASNTDCEPGSQCFTFSAKSVGCSVMTCLRFCNNDDSMCGEQGAYCNVPIPCGNSEPFLACSRPCDPTGTGSVGCAAGLSCFVYSKETTDCACAGLGDMGAACTQNSACDSEPSCTGGCRAGLSCVVPTGSGAGASGACRPICTLAAPACPTGTTCRAFDGSTRLVYGFCQ